MSPERLTDDPSLYFTSLDNAQLVPLARLTASKSAASQPDSVERAEELMRAAARGHQSRRPPISIRADGDGYLVVDGNATFAVAQRHGWTTIPAIVETGE